MRRLIELFMMMVMMLFLAGCAGQIKTGALSYSADSIPPEVAHIDGSVPALVVNWSVDPWVAITKAIDGIKTLGFGADVD